MRSSRKGTPKASPSASASPRPRNGQPATTRNCRSRNRANSRRCTERACPNPRMNAESCPTDSEAKLRYLQAALAPAPGGEAVRRLETHMSWLLLGGDKVLKLKRPVRYPFLDFSTVQARERDAREEIRVNRRLAPGIYLGLLALQWNE